MSQNVATQQLTFDDFHKDEYWAFKVKGQPDCISLPAICDRLKDVLMELERQMEQGDHLSITLSVNRPSDNPFEDDLSSAIQRSIRSPLYGGPYGIGHP